MSDSIGKLHVRVVEARSLAPADITSGTSDPYALVNLGKNKYKTQTVYKSLNPKWNEDFTFDVQDPLGIIVITIYDRDIIGSDDFLGEVNVSLSELEDGEPHDQWYKLQPRNKKKADVTGDVHLRLHYLYDKDKKRMSSGPERKKSLFNLGKRGSTVLKRDDKHYAAPPGYQLFSCANYFFFADDGYTAQLDPHTRKPDGKYITAPSADYQKKFEQQSNLTAQLKQVNEQIEKLQKKAEKLEAEIKLSEEGLKKFDKEAFVQFTADTPMPMDTLGRLPVLKLPSRKGGNTLLGIESSLGNRAERIARQLAVAHTNEEEFTLHVSKSYQRKMNLTGDQAQWFAWEVHVKTASRDLGVMVLRRAYIPALGDTYQDLMFVAYGPENRYNDHFLVPLEKIADSISFETQMDYDEVSIQNKMNTLSYNESLYEHFFSRFHFQPTIADRARDFYRKIEQLYERENQFEKERAVGLEDDMEPFFTPNDDPFVVVDALNTDPRNALGLNARSPHQEWDEWNRRVARYLAHYVDSPSLGKLGLEELVEMYKRPTCSPLMKQFLSRLLDYFVFLCPINGSYSNKALAQKLLEPEYSQDLYINEYMLCRLTELGYIPSVLEAERPMLFGSFLVRLLRREESGLDLHTTACQQVAAICTDPRQRDWLLRCGVVPTLAQLMEVDDELLLQAIAKALVNLSAGSDQAKDSIMSEGCTKHIVPHLLVSNYELTRMFALIIKNCTNKPEHRSKLLEDGALPPLVRLLKTSLVPANKAKESMIVAVVSAIWNVAANDNTRNAITDAGAVPLLVDMLQTTESDLLLEKICGALMVLSIHHDANQSLVGQLGAVQRLCPILMTTANTNLRRNVLACLVPLSGDPANLDRMREEGIEDIVGDVARSAQDWSTLIFCKQLQDRFNMTGRADIERETARMKGEVDRRRLTRWKSTAKDIIYRSGSSTARSNTSLHPSSR